ncbi:hypothetical protein [Planobispora longispora]|uniref:Uncharacterized protein n=1 Tax=Planobispora longispora TaxID=28887 RepID=A0A8J3W646_9ACTN|nr:hypothetical protein [Planobispora longispora]BFE79571.1 hypothetical protein GCM10020093_021720 [Planobispora longispora]GIH78124.1 hypothetical protein Plo01_45530 [Planobispora longispora]
MRAARRHSGTWGSTEFAAEAFHAYVQRPGITIHPAENGPVGQLNLTPGPKISSKKTYILN